MKKINPCEEKRLSLRNAHCALHLPTLDELQYREKLLSNPKTMEYNKGYNLGFPEYDNETG